jgi:hypothetical protein
MIKKKGDAIFQKNYFLKYLLASNHYYHFLNTSLNFNIIFYELDTKYMKFSIDLLAIEVMMHNLEEQMHLYRKH